MLSNSRGQLHRSFSDPPFESPAPLPIRNSRQEKERQQAESAIDQSLESILIGDVGSQISNTDQVENKLRMSRYATQMSGDLLGDLRQVDDDTFSSASSSSSITPTGRVHGRPIPYVHQRPDRSLSSDEESYHMGSSTISSVEYPRSGLLAASARSHNLPHSRQGKENTAADSTYNSHSLFVGASPVSSAGHHASAMTLGLGVFDQKRSNQNQNRNEAEEYDPDRSLGRLVKQLKAKGGNWEKLGEKGTSKVGLGETNRLNRQPQGQQSSTQNGSVKPPMMNKASQFLPVPTQQHQPSRSSPLRAETVFSSFSAEAEKSGLAHGSKMKKSKDDEDNTGFTDLMREMRADLGMNRPEIGKSKLPGTGFESMMTSTPAPASRSKKGSTEPVDILGMDDDTPRPIRKQPFQQSYNQQRMQQSLRTESARVHPSGRSVSDGEVRSRKQQPLTAERPSMTRVTSDTSRPKTNLQPPILPDLTALSGLLGTPAKGARFADVGHNAAGAEQSPILPKSIQHMYARMQALEQETTVSRQRVRELESELEEARAEAEQARTETNVRSTGEAKDWEEKVKKLQEQKNDLEVLVLTLRQNMKKLTQDWETEMAHVVSLRRQLQRQNSTESRSPKKTESGSSTDVYGLYEEAISRIQKLEAEVKRLKLTVIEALEIRQTIKEDMKDDKSRSTDGDQCGPGPDSQFDVGVQTVAYDGTAEKGAQSHQVNAEDDGHNSPSPRISGQSRLKTRRSGLTETPRRRDFNGSQDPATSPFPAIRGDDLERDFFSPPRKVNAAPSQFSQGTASETMNKQPAADQKLRDVERAISTADGRAPRQSLVISVLREIEDDYRHYLKIYSELSEQYKRMAPTHVKRNILAEHLKEVIDTMEEKANQVARLTESLELRDKTYKAPTVLKAAQASRRRMTVPETVKTIRKDLGHEAVTSPYSATTASRARTRKAERA